ncbi:hypothetical protein FB451DRAFT_1563419 [Mycena latifolia]|nr:hypothetical protein FB451DRAFT_1563419 [Mycena latifolia]
MLHSLPGGTTRSLPSSDSIITSTKVAAGFLQEIANFTNNVPFLDVVAGVSILILETVESVKSNKEKCMSMIERIYDILRALINLCADAEPLLSTAIVEGIAQFAETLQKIQSFIRVQQDMGTIKRFFRTADSTVQLEECNVGLNRALEKFTVHTELSSTKTLLEMQAATEERYKELLVLIESRSDTDSFASSVTTFQTFHNSSSSISVLLPARPKIFHGREDELKHIVAIFEQDCPRLVILGTGGIGKTALGLSVLYEQCIQDRFKHRYFISCESASNSSDIVSAIAETIGLPESEQTLTAVIQQLSAAQSTLLLLDNLETPWEPFESRADVESLLSQLTDIRHLALLVTMRGMERPGKVRWTRPFLAPLNPLSRDAAMATLVDIADNQGDGTRSRMHEVLDFTDNMPLAVTLMGALVSFEGYASVIESWKLDNTSLLSEGHAKTSNLDKSIFMSISSPRMMSSFGAHDLLSVLSLLPDGISDSELTMLRLPIPNMGSARAALLRTSLAYAGDGRLKTLAPIRQYVLKTYPPAPALVQRLIKYAYEMLVIWKSYRRMPSADLVPRLRANLGNLRTVLLHTVDIEQVQEDLILTGQTILMLHQFTETTTTHGSGSHSKLIRLLPEIVERAGDDELHGRYLMAQFSDHYDYNLADPENLIQKAVRHFRNAGSVSEEASLYNAVCAYYHHQSDLPKAWEYCHRALELSKENDNELEQGIAAHWMTGIQYRRGNYTEGMAYGFEARRLAKRAGNFPLEAACMRAQALSCVALGDFKHGAALCAEARKLLLACALGGGDLDLALMSLEAEILYQKSEYAESLAIHRTSASLTSTTARPVDHAYALVNIATIEIITGISDESVLEHLNGARDIFTTCSYPRGICNCDVVLADLYYRQGRLVEAQSLYAKCLDITRGRDIEIPVLCLEKLGDIRYDLQDVLGAFRYRTVYLALASKGKNAAATLHALRRFGDVLGNLDDWDTARSVFEVTLDGFTTMGIHQGVIDCKSRLDSLESASCVALEVTPRVVEVLD